MGTTQTPPTPAESRKNLLELLRDFDTAMVTTRGLDGEPHARPMAIARLDDDGRMYFAARADSPKVDEIREDSDVLVTVQGKLKFATVSGLCRLNRDRVLIHTLWKDSWKTWFDGKDDPRIVILEVIPQRAEYWDNGGVRGAALLFDTIKSMMGGKPQEPPADSNVKVDLGRVH